MWKLLRTFKRLLVLGEIQGRPPMLRLIADKSHDTNIFCPENVVYFLRLLHLIKFTSD